MKTITIDRKTWLRGEGMSDSKLLRKRDQKMCCLGFALNQCGISKEILTDLAAPDQLDEELPNELQWLLNNSIIRNKNSRTNDCQNLMIKNDSTLQKDKEREEFITETFAKYNLKIEFIN